MKANKIYLILLLFLVVLNILPIAAPVAAHFGWYKFAHAIYSIYSVFCHQFHWRSIHLFDFQSAWCVRDTFIWAGFLISSIAVFMGFLTKEIKWYWLLTFAIPILLDGGLQTIFTLIAFHTNTPILYLSTNLMRMVTGSIFGIGLGWIISSILAQP